MACNYSQSYSIIQQMPAVNPASKAGSADLIPETSQGFHGFNL